MRHLNIRDLPILGMPKVVPAVYVNKAENGGCGSMSNYNLSIPTQLINDLLIDFSLMVTAGSPNTPSGFTSKVANTGTRLAVAQAIANAQMVAQSFTTDNAQAIMLFALRGVLLADVVWPSAMSYTAGASLNVPSHPDGPAGTSFLLHGGSWANSSPAGWTLVAATSTYCSGSSGVRSRLSKRAHAGGAGSAATVTGVDRLSGCQFLVPGMTF